MKTALKWSAGAVLLILALGGILALLGLTLPVGHRATGVALIEAPPDELWRSISDFEAGPTWRSDVERVEVLSGEGEGTLFREHGATGPLTMRVERFEPPRLLVTRIADEDLPFGGTWTFEIDPAGGDFSHVRITENGEIHSALFRTISRWVFGYTGTLEGYLEDLARRHGQSSVEIEADWEHREDGS